MSNSPLFSVMIPTIGRSHVVHYAIESVLRQSFKDFEIVLVDNDTSDATAKVCKKYCDDARFHYHRTGGLPMQDNWEYGLNRSSGKFFLVLQDKMFLSRHALTKLKTILEKDNPDFCVWLTAYYDEERNRFNPNLLGQYFPFRPDSSFVTQKQEWMESDATLRVLARCNMPKYFMIAPRGINCVSSLENIRKVSQSHPDGRFFTSETPDFDSGFAQLLTFKKYLLINYPLSCFSFMYLSGGHAAIMKQQSKGSTQEWLKQRLGVLRGAGGNLTYDHTLIKCVRANNSIINEFLRILPRFQRENDFPLDLVEYFLMNWQEIKFAESQGVDMAEEIQAYHTALELLDDKDIVNKILIEMQNGEYSSHLRFHYETFFQKILSQKKTMRQKIIREVARTFRKLFRSKTPKLQFESIDAFLNQY